MAIQKINLGTEPLGEGGDTYRSANTKINENFSNTEHAASRLVGTSTGNVVEMTSEGIAGTGWGVKKLTPQSDASLLPSQMSSGLYVFANSGNVAPPNLGIYDRMCLVLKRQATDTGNAIWFPYGAQSTGDIVVEQFRQNNREFYTLYSDKNTKKDSNTNLLLTSKDSIPSTSAASRLVGTANGNVVEMTENGIAGTGIGGRMSTVRGQTGGMPTGAYYLGTGSSPFGGGKFVLDVRYTSGTQAFRISNAFYSNKFYLHGSVNPESGGEPNQLQEGVEIYHTGNVTKDGNGFLKASSPVVDLYDDRIELNNDAEKQGVELVKNGTGNYTLKTKTGLRSDNTWQIEVPQDNNKNPLLAVDIDAKEDGTINIKCYKRIFSMETFLFGPDFNEPMDITEGRFISVRLNDNPEEELDEHEPEEEATEGEAVDPEVVEEPTEEPSEESE